jgi:CheY-like chemotaxis protein
MFEPAQARVGIVDDRCKRLSDFVCNGCCQLTHRRDLCDFMVFEAPSADEAIKIIETRVPINLVLTDVRMFGSMNGFGLAKWIGSNHRSASLLLLGKPRKQMQRTNSVITFRFSKSLTT